MEVAINYWAVILAGLSSMAVGSIWYSMKVFGQKWAKLARVDMSKEMKTGPLATMLGLTFVASLITALILAYAVFMTNEFFGNSYLQDALATGLWAWLGFTALRFWTHDMFEGRPRQLTLLNAANEFVTIMVMALIIGLLGV